MIVIAIIGILAAIALPAYSSYMKKAKYTEIMNVAESVKTPIALCLQEYGIVNATNCKNSSSGFGWEIKAAGDYKTKYVATVTVAGTSQTKSVVSKDTSVVKITVTPDSTNFKSTDTLVLTGDWTSAGQLNWKVDASSGCIAAELCKAS
ncbi:MAG: pilus assembly protein TapA [Succinivibrionaceae bacterium]